jgi:putative ABC transport system permease protein
MRLIDGDEYMTMKAVGWLVGLAEFTPGFSGQGSGFRQNRSYHSRMRYPIRSLLRQPGFTFVAILTLALGIGANTAIFSVVDAVVLRPLPYPEADRVLVLMERAPKFPNPISLSVLNFPDVRNQAHSYGSVGVVRNVTMNLTGGEEPLRVNAKMITADVLTTLRVPPALGRNFTSQEDHAGAAPVAIISYGLWQSRFGGSRDVVGRALQLDGVPATIVGVLPAQFRLFQPADVYVPIWPWLSGQPQDRTWHPGLIGLARLKPGVTLNAAQRELDDISARLQKTYPDSNLDVRFVAMPALTLMVQGVRTALLVLLGAVSGVLLIACINVAGLLLARGLARKRELAVRAALGAGRAAIVRQVLLESLLLALAGGAAGIMLASFLVSALLDLVGTSLPRADAVAIDARVMVFTLVLSILTALLFGTLPALASTRVDIRDALAEGGRGAAGGRWQSRTRRILVVTEIALTVMLLVAAGLLMRSFVRLQQVSPGFTTEHLLVADIPLSPKTYAADQARTNAVEHLIERARSLPAASGAAVTTILPLSGSGSALHFNIQGRPPKSARDWILANFRAVSHSYFETMRIPIRRGRGFTPVDRQGAPTVVIVNAAFVRQFFPDVDPLGRRIALGTEFDGTLPWLEIVGVVGDVLQAPDADAKSEMYVPYEQYPDPFFTRMYQNITLVVRSTAGTETLAPALRQIVREIDRNQPIVNVRTMDDVVAGAVAQPRFRTTLLALFAGIALVLAAVGIYGLLAHAVVQRQQEFGVRLALGASPGQVLRMVIGEALALAAIGLLAGLAAAFFAARLLASVLFAIKPSDPLTWMVAAGALALAAFVASWIPARRAVKVDPVWALRVS